MTRNQAVQDRTGWDFLVEFPRIDVPGVPADLQPIGPSARVQVKSRREGRPSVAIKLSNALQFAKSSEPCFVVLFLPDDHGGARTYARHVWTDMITATLRRVRIAESRGKTDLNRQTLTISFNDEDEHSADLLDWMRAEIAAVGGLYAHRKGALEATVGMEDGGIHGRITFDDIDWSAFVDHQLGLTANVPVARISIEQRRFGVDTPVIAFKPDLASIRCSPQPCRLRIRGGDRSEVWLDGELRAAVFPDMPPEFARYRITADMLDLVTDLQPASATGFRMSSSRTDQLTLEGLAKRLELTRLVGLGPLDIQVRMDGRILFGAVCTPDPGITFDWTKDFAAVVSMLRSVAAEDLPEGLTLSIGEIDDAWTEVVDFNGMVAGTDLGIKMKLANRRLGELGGGPLWTYGHVDIGGWSFMAVVSRPVDSIDDRGDALDMTFGDPVIVESLVRPRQEEGRLEELAEVYRRCFKLAGGVGFELFGGDYQAMLRRFDAPARDQV